LAKLPKKQDENLLVGYETSDDAGVYRIDDETAIVTTADFITPPVDDPYLFGQIGAANAISDVYAMGGKPISALNLIGFPSTRLGPEVLHGIVEGALSKITESGAVLAGGHTTEDEEPKFGLSVNGIVHPQKIWRNTGAKPGDALILTKAIGSGVLFNANLKNWVSDEAMKACLASVTMLNRTAAQILQSFHVHAATDVTGFGLAGHGLEMARGSNAMLSIDLNALPTMDSALAMYEKGMNTGVNRFNEEMVKDYLRFGRELPAWHQEIVYDPQTSGGLLVALPADEAAQAVEQLVAEGNPAAAIIGEVLPENEGQYLEFL